MIKVLAMKFSEDYRGVQIIAMIRVFRQIVAVRNGGDEVVKGIPLCGYCSTIGRRLFGGFGRVMYISVSFVAVLLGHSHLQWPISTLPVLRFPCRHCKLLAHHFPDC